MKVAQAYLQRGNIQSSLVSRLLFYAANSHLFLLLCLKEIKLQVLVFFHNLGLFFENLIVENYFEWKTGS